MVLITRAQRGMLAFAVVSLTAFVVSPASVRPAIVQLFGWVATISVVRSTRRLPRTEREPWVLLSIAGFGALSGGLARFIHGLIIGVAKPVPSPADLLWAVAYLSILGCEVLLIRRRTARGERGHLLDALLPTAGVGLALWAFLFGPYLTGDIHPLDERLVNLFFLFVSMAILAATLRLAVGHGAKPPAYHLLAGAVTALLLSDFLQVITTSRGWDESLNQYPAIPIFALMALAATHPSAGNIAARPEGELATLTRRRVGLLSVALLISPVVLLFDTIDSSGGKHPYLVIGGSSLMSLLVLARIVQLVRAEEASRGRERTLRLTGEQLLLASGVDEIMWLANSGAVSILGTINARVSLVHLGASDEIRRFGPRFTHDSAANRAETAEPLVANVNMLDPLVVPALRALRPTILFDHRPIDLWSDEQHERVIHVLPVASTDRIHGVLVVSTDRALEVGVRDSLETMARECGLALRSLEVAGLLARQSAERRFEALVENANDIVAVVSQSQRLSFVSPAATRLLGFPDQFLLGRDPLELVHPEDRVRLTNISDLLEQTTELRLRTVTGTFHWFELQVRDLSGTEEIDGFVINARHIGDRKRAERLLQRSESRFRALVQRSSDLVAVVSTEGVIEYMSPAVESILGLPGEQLVGAGLLSVFRSDQLAEYLHRAQGDGSRIDTRTIEAEASGVNGDRVIELTVSDLRSEPGIEGIVLNGRDVTERRGLETSLRHQALHDDLTGLPNRTLLMDRLGAALATAPGLPIGLLFLDLDDFKDINDSLGHEAGDQLLATVAERLGGSVRLGDLAARIGGDEFAVLVSSALGEASILEICDRIMESLARPIVVGGRSVSTRVSIGVALDFGRDQTAEVLLRNADVAMYRAKERGKGRVEIYEEHLHASAFHRFEVRTELHRAIEANELRVYYQPLVELPSTRIIGAEALVRWQHPSKGLLGPVDFIPVAEATGLIIPLGRWVMAEATRQAAEWNRNGAGLHIGVNVSVRQLDHEPFLAELDEILASSGLSPKDLCVEITESVFVSDPERAIARLTELRARGISVAIDDFGTGYSSLVQVQDFPFDVLKIDKSFVDRVGGEHRQEGVIRTIMRLGADLGVITVAEGIEDYSQLQALIELGCDQGQGYYFSRPVTAEAFEELLASSTELMPS